MDATGQTEFLPPSAGDVLLAIFGGSEMREMEHVVWCKEELEERGSAGRRR